MIYLIGDSHTLMHKGLEPEISTHHFGACTAYGLMTTNSQTGSLKKLLNFLSNKNRNDIIILGFGEIDCRVLIYYKHIEFGISISDMIDIVVYRYYSTIDYIRNRGFTVAIHGPTPAVRQGNEYKLKHYADENIRSYISLKFNKILRLKCHKENILYFDCQSLPYIKGEDGLTPENILLKDKVHIDPNKVPIGKDFKEWMKVWSLLS